MCFVCFLRQGIMYPSRHQTWLCSQDRPWTLSDPPLLHPECWEYKRTMSPGRNSVIIVSQNSLKKKWINSAQRLRSNFQSFFSWDRLLCNLEHMYYVPQVDSELINTPSLPLKCWVYRYVPPCPTQVNSNAIQCKESLIWCVHAEERQYWKSLFSISKLLLL